MINGIKFRKICNEDILEVGWLVEGYTYLPNDFHSSEKVHNMWLGQAKLRTGVIIENYDNLYFKIQFWNSNALKLDDHWSVNSIDVSINDDLQTSIIGEDKYCIVVRRSQISNISNTKTVIIGDINRIQKEIYKKHSSQKKRATMYFRKKLYLTRPDVVTDKILKLYQFTPTELKMANSVIYKKFRLIWLRHISKYKCVNREISKMKQAINLIEDNNELYKISNMLLELINYNHNSDHPYHFDEENAVSVIVDFFNPKLRYE